MEAATQHLIEATGAAVSAITCERIWHSPAVNFDPGCVAAVSKSAADAGFSPMEIISGAGHDSVYISRIAPTAMIFVPCKDGLSHNPLESSTVDQCGAGAQTLLGAVLAYAERL
jgi:N-carbamoyl-L-amino-acid hydrolase